VDLTYPERVSEVVATVREAGAAGRRLRIVGGRRHMARAGATGADAELWTTSLDGIVTYDPSEMIVVVRAGTRLDDLRAVLAEGGQEWPTDEPGDATVGGVIAAGVDPVRRLRTGLVRDTVVELEAVLGDARVVRSGARVVKNVSGFDVHRLLTGSLGTLGVITQVALKVRPLPKAAVTLVTVDGGLELGDRLLDALWQPAAVLAEPGRVVVRLEGWPGEVAEQTATARAVATCEESEEPITPGVDLFPDAPIVLELGGVPSDLRSVVSAHDDFRALPGVGVVWVPCTSAEDLDDVSVAVDASVPARADLPLPRPPRSALERRVRAALDPGSVFAGA
jgi:glycolate oxidase FAD binding subunit